MKKLLFVIALAGLLAGCAPHDNGTNGAGNPYDNTGEATNHGIGMFQ